MKKIKEEEKCDACNGTGFDFNASYSVVAIVNFSFCLVCRGTGKKKKDS